MRQEHKDAPFERQLARLRRVLSGVTDSTFENVVTDGTRRRVAALRREAEGMASPRLLQRIQAVERLVNIKPQAGPAVGTVFRDCEGCPEMVVVPAGEYLMGSPTSEEGRADDEGPRHRVTIGEPFAVGVYEVTRGEYARFVAETGHATGDSCWTYESGEWKDRSGRSWRDPGFAQTDWHPAACVSWDDVQGYMRWLSKETGWEYRLLSESEWEYVARAGTTTPFHTGRTISTDQANYDGNYTYGGGREGEYRERTVPVGSFGPNGFGLHDVHGNVWEWTQDCWNESYRGAPVDGSAWERGDCGRRVVRGGSWDDVPGNLRSADRRGLGTGLRGGPRRLPGCPDAHPVNR